MVRNSFRLIRGIWSENGGFTQGILPNLGSLCRGDFADAIDMPLAGRSEEINASPQTYNRCLIICQYQQ